MEIKVILVKIYTELAVLRIFIFSAKKLLLLKLVISLDYVPLNLSVNSLGGIISLNDTGQYN